MTCGMVLELGLDGVVRSVRAPGAAERVAVEGEVRVEVRLLPLLPDGGMASLLRAALGSAGWIEGESGGLCRPVGDAMAVLEAGGTVVRVSRVAVASSLPGGVGGVRVELGVENARALTEAEATVRAELAAAVDGVHREAVMQRARALGDVESVTENGSAGGGYELTVVVRG